MNTKLINLYKVNTDYTKYLLKFDEKIPYNIKTKTFDKERRPFVGFVFRNNNFYYFIPLYSYKKEKDKNLKNNFYTTILADNKNKRFGILRFNYMIPVIKGMYNVIDTKIYSSDSKSDIQWKHILNKDKSYLSNQSRQEKIIKKAIKYYNLYCKNQNLSFKHTNLLLDEEKAIEFAKINKIDIKLENSKDIVQVLEIKEKSKLNKLKTITIPLEEYNNMKNIINYIKNNNNNIER